ncbi:YesL family protein [Jeotgalibacillus terrae]|uniref:YesL family protein n=1 Tax=Jeotgalibacillus terrae TaxID=587735 RepID=A0ABW5ZC68_9BACL|nr:DUF624 domain-containing protein [Jeotgalibacillus terrae]MBM7580126.1 putative membrane protein YesL [Jeotgalibacillus terrae]
MSGWGTFNKASYWMIRAAYLNILWILFTVIGLGIFGLFPATVAMFTIAKQWMIEKDLSLKIFKQFTHVYFQQFVKANLYGVIFGVIAYIIYIDFMFIYSNEQLGIYLLPVIGLMAVIFTAMLAFFFPVYVHFELSFWKYLKQTFLITIASPFQYVIILLSAIALGFLITLLPGIIPLFTGSVMALIITYLTGQSLHQIQNKRKKQLSA